MIKNEGNISEELSHCLKEVRKDPQNRAHEFVELCEPDSVLNEKLDFQIEKLKKRYKEFCLKYLEYVFRKFLDGDKLDILIAIYQLSPEYQDMSLGKRRENYYLEFYQTNSLLKNRNRGNIRQLLQQVEDEIIIELSIVLSLNFKEYNKSGFILGFVDDIVNKKNVVETQVESNCIKEETLSPAIQGMSESRSKSLILKYVDFLFENETSFRIDVKEELMRIETQRQESRVPSVIENTETQPTENTPENTDTLSFVNGYSEKFKNWKQNVRNILIHFNKYTKLAYTALSIIVSATNYNYQSRILPESVGCYSVATKVRLSKDTDRTWKKSVDAKIGDKVDFLIEHTNTSDKWQNDVVARDILPPNLEYIPGSTVIKNGAHPNGAVVQEDDLVDDGIFVGSYAPNANLLVRFTAEVVNDDFTCGKFILHNWGRASVNGKLVQDSAAVNVQLAYCPNPEKSL